MNGWYAFNAAARHAERIAAAASVYGTQLVTDQPDSPHLVARKATAELYFACAEIEEHLPVEMVQALETALSRQPRRLLRRTNPGGRLS